MYQFDLKARFKPKGDQPKAIKQLSQGIKQGLENQVLLGVTGSGKTFVLANVLEKTQLPTLIISPNKTLAAQLYQEFKEFFPQNAVHYFVSYYDYYQPEAYLPQTNTYIEKDAKINQQIDRLRHATTQDLLQRKDVIVIASVSCIYGLGSPTNYQESALTIKKGQKMSRENFLYKLVDLQYQKNDEFNPGNFRTRGEVVEVNLITGEGILKVEFNNNFVADIKPTNQTTRQPDNQTTIFPANFWASAEEKVRVARENIKQELREQLRKLRQENKTLEAERLEKRTNYDLETMATMGSCPGIENYSLYLEARKPGEPPFTLLDYFKRNGDFLIILDESHIALPQLQAMFNTDRSRKKILIEHGFRLPSCLDNRPLNFKEFENKTQQIIYSSATPGEYELVKSKRQKMNGITELLIRPTGLLEPTVEIRPLKNQVKDLIEEIKARKAKNQRSLAITLTKKTAEDLSLFLKEQGIKAEYLHSEIKTLARPVILQKLRQGKIDVLVGVNLLREGLDLPEVALIGILDADKEGFLRNKTTLIQTMGRAARNLDGHCILYADQITSSIKKAISEIKRRREIQTTFNKKNKINPQSIKSSIKAWTLEEDKGVKAEFGLISDIKLLEKEMLTAANNLDFERAAEIRDLLNKTKRQKKNLQK